MEFISIKQTLFFNTAKTTLTLIGFTVFLLTILALGSCGKKKIGSDPQLDYMSFALTNASGSAIAINTPLSRGSTYGLVITPGNGVVPATADYVVTHIPTAAITRSVTHTNSVGFTVNNTADTSVTFTVTHRTASAVRETITLTLALQAPTSTAFQQDIENATTVPNFATAKSPLTREVLEPLRANAGATLEKRYITEFGAGRYDGSSWGDAWAGTNIINAISLMNDASANKVYLFMVAGGTYKPDSSSTTVTDKRETSSYGMKNYMAIMGGFQTGGGWARTGTTIFSGDIGVVGDNTDNSYHVFSFYSAILNKEAHLYGVTITDGNANGSKNTQKYGGGVYIQSASPTLTRVVLANNNALEGGGGLFANDSFAFIKDSVFIGNSAQSSGGGMRVDAGGLLTVNTMFISNDSVRLGGGVHRIGGTTGSGATSLLTIIGSVFRGNSAQYGGGLYKDSSSAHLGAVIANTIFSGNTTNVATGEGPDIAMNLNTGGGTETVRIVGSVLGIGLAEPTNGIVGYNGDASLNLAYYSLANGPVNFGADTTTEGITYPTITTGSSAINIGLYVKRDGSGTTATYYFSDNDNIWYGRFTQEGTFIGAPIIPPANAEDLTATDIAGNPRVGRPDAGVYEVQ